MFRKRTSKYDSNKKLTFNKVKNNYNAQEYAGVIDEENDTFEGTLTITEAFIVDTKHPRKVCAFIRGYCTGVLNTLLNNSEVELTCRSCPLEKKFNCKCVFDVKMKG